MDGVYDKLHYLGPASLIGGGLLFIAVLIQRGFSPESGKIFLILLLLWIGNTVLTYLTAKAESIRKSQKGN